MNYINYFFSPKCSLLGSCIFLIHQLKDVIHMYIAYFSFITAMKATLDNRLLISLFLTIAFAMVCQTKDESAGNKHMNQNHRCMTRGKQLLIHHFRKETCSKCYTYMPESQFKDKWKPTTNLWLTNGSLEVVA